MIRSPAVVSLLHAQLVSIVRHYHGQLRAAARTARARSGGEQQAGAALISSTQAASSSFAATVAKIDRSLGR